MVRRDHNVIPDRRVKNDLHRRAVRRDWPLPASRAGAPAEGVGVGVGSARCASGLERERENERERERERIVSTRRRTAGRLLEVARKCGYTQILTV